MEITDKIATDTLSKLVADKTNKLNNTPAFLEEEREALQYEINAYKTHLKKIAGCCNDI